MTDWIKEARARCEEATTGPWLKGNWRGQCHLKHQHGNGNCKYDYTYDYTFDTEAPCICLAEENVTLIGYDDYGPILKESDAEFIAHARTDLPRALDEIARLRETLALIAEGEGSEESWYMQMAEAALKGKESI